MKLSLAAVALLVVGCHAQVPAASAKIVDTRSSAKRAEDRSVAIVEGQHAVCGGVWLDESTILTAFHCVSDAGKLKGLDAANALLGSLGIESNPYDDAPWDPTGAVVTYTDRAGSASKPMSTYSAIVTRFDRDNDLALLTAGVLFPLPSHHDAAPLATGEIHDGDAVDVVGSTVGYPFTFLRGVVSATREPHETTFKTLQLAVAGVNHGNSGGGAFDAHGRLVGIADYMLTVFGDDVPSVAFYIHRDVLRTFLAAS